MNEYHERQFTIRHVMVLTFATGVVMAMIRYLGLLSTAAMAVVASPVLFAVTICLLGTRRANRLAEVLFVLLVVGILITAFILR